MATDAPAAKKYARFEIDGAVSYGLVENDRVRKIDGDLLGQHKVTDKSYPLESVKLLVPVVPKQVLAMAGNYKSHLKEETIPPKFQIPQVFYKTVSCLTPQGGAIVLPRDSKEVHYEGELVIVIGRRASRVSEKEALDYVFGVTCGNDVSARDWQKDDVQWWRAKGADTFGPCGPFVVAGIKYDDLRVQTRVNGKTKQDQRTSDLIHSVPKMVSAISRHVTLEPGDLIYTGTSGKTEAIHAGDVVEVEIEGIGTLRNPVVSESESAR